MMNKMVAVKEMEVVGMVIDMNEKGNVIYVENDKDVYMVDMDKYEVSEIDNHVKYAEIKDVKEEVNNIVRYMDEDEYELFVEIFEAETDAETHKEYDVQVVVFVEGEEVDSFALDQYTNLKDAKKRANAVKQSFKGKFNLNNKVRHFVDLVGVIN